ncbi:hypothetical protein K440DRAFT_651758 [Wilcoxina mikolae CBS 423.85]|nr:hypothetical protein K440DRAFT_651758 [Wilcoxina mikolae CBS 423.85]
MSDFRAAADQQPENSSDEPPQKSRTFVSSAVEHDERVEAQQAELRGVQQMNSVIEGVVSSLEKANKNMETVASAVDNANKLLNLWIKILSQAEHTQRLLQSEHWEGANKEMADIQAEAQAKKQEARRRAEEARERAAAREREVAAAEAKRAAAEKKPVRGGRKGVPAAGTVRGGSRIGSGPSSSSTRGAPASRTTRGGIGRGAYGSVRGRGRGST